MRTALLSALLAGGLAFALPAHAAEDPLAPLTVEEDPLAPLTGNEPTKPSKPAKPKPKPKPDKPKPPPVEKVEKPKPPPPEKPVEARRINADKIKISGVPPMALKVGQSATLTFKVTDPAGRPVNVELALTASAGTITAAVETAVGTYGATFAPPSTGTDSLAVVRAEVKNGVKPVFAEARISLTPPPPPIEPVSLIGPPSTEPEPKKPGPTPAKVAFAEAKGQAGEPVKVRFQLEDRQGNMVGPEGVTLKSTGGKFENIREESGTYVADFIPSNSGDVAVYAEVGGERIAGEGNVVVEAKGGSSKFGGAVGVFVGGLTNFGKVASPQFELNAEAKLFRVIRVGVLGGYAPAFASDVNEEPAGGNRVADFNFTVIPLMFRAAYQQPVGPIEITAGGMIGVAFVNGTAKPQGGGTEVSISRTELDMAAFVGGGLPLGPGILLVEIRASRLMIDYADAQIAVKGNLGGFSGALGYKFEF